MLLKSDSSKNILKMNRLKMKTRKWQWLIIMAVLVLTSCKVTQNYKRPVAVAGNALYRDVKTTDTTTIADISWKQMFTDTILQHLIQEGINNNLDLKIAMSRIKQTQANLQAGNAALFPSLNVHGTYTDQKSANNAPGNTKYYQLYGNSSWEIDIWGKLRSAKRAALASLFQSEAYKRAVQTQLVSDIATNYYTLLAYDEQLQLTLKTVDFRIQDVATMKILKEADVVTGAAVVESEANHYSVEVTIPDLNQNIRVTENALSVLLGRNPGAIVRDSLKNQQVRTELQTGVAAQLLSHRPDVQEAESQLRYYFELTNLARSYFYPSLTITAQGGFSNGTLSALLNSTSIFGNIVGGLVQPIFNQGLNKQRLNIAKAQQEESLSAFQKALLNAGQEVSNALFSYQTASDKMKSRSLQIGFLEKSVDYTKELVKYTKTVNYTDVLTAEESLLSAQLNSINDRVQQLDAIVSLYRSLGGGWK